MIAQSGAASTAAVLTASLPTRLRPFVLIDSAAMSPATAAEVALSLGEAAGLIASVIRPDRTCNMVFGTSPFRLNLGNGNLVFTPLDHVVQARVNSIIFIDIEKLLTYKPPYRVAMLLEELVHVLMHVEDELYVRSVVAELYPGISIVDGKYQATDG